MEYETILWWNECGNVLGVFLLWLKRRIDFMMLSLSVFLLHTRTCLFILNVTVMVLWLIFLWCFFSWNVFLYLHAREPKASLKLELSSLCFLSHFFFHWAGFECNIKPCLCDIMNKIESASYILICTSKLLHFQVAIH